MTPNLGRETAKIYQFPLHKLQQTRFGASYQSGKTGTISVAYEHCFSSWYHEDAIREEDASRKQ